MTQIDELLEKVQEHLERFGGSSSHCHDYIAQALAKLRAEQPPAGEFTEDFRKFIEHPLSTLKLKRWHTKSLDLCNRLDAETQRANKMDMLYTKCNTERLQFEAKIEALESRPASVECPKCKAIIKTA